MSFRLKTILGVACIEALLLVVLIIGGLTLLQQSNENALAQRASSTAGLFASMAKGPVLAMDLATLDTFVDEALKNEGVVYVRVTGRDGTVLAAKGAGAVLARPFVADLRVDQVSDGVFDTYAEVAEGREVYGRIELGLATAGLQALLAEARRQGVGVAVTELLLSALFSLAFGTYLTRSLRRLTRASTRIAEGEYGVQIEVSGRDEIAATARAFNVMSAQIAVMYRDMERQVAERTAQLSRSEARLRAILDNMGEGVVTVNGDGRIESANPAAEKIFAAAGALENTPAERYMGRLPRLQPPVPCDSGSASTREVPVQRVERAGRRADGTEFPMDLTVTPTAVAGEHLTICLVRDITRRKEAEQHLAEAQQQFLAAAHRAGMAEIATEVLHNIGNIANSLCLSVDEMRALVKNSKLAGLKKANELLTAHKDDLIDFLTRDSKGSKLPEYYIKLGHVVSEEFDKLSAEMEVVTERVSMIKAVISTQQEYARAESFAEELELEPLLDDALRVERMSLEKWGVKVERRIPELPPCRAQKTKLLQVLTNIIKNAKEAMRDNDQYNKPKLLVIEAWAEVDGCVCLSFTDNGCGIEKNTMKEIFQHGFTTREDGHGFGLHYCANAVKEMGGTLQVFSDGPRRGARFELRLAGSRSSAQGPDLKRKAG
ncbi:MAG TPA: PAS domain S-box protein [Gammaproteobacteria bacterium]|nr:PAS domain S-box protein [Gammaproteobacteria bacterium]